MSGSTTTPAAAPAYNYTVTQEGHGFPIGTIISDAATIAAIDTDAQWVVRTAATAPAPATTDTKGS